MYQHCREEVARDAWITYKKTQALLQSLLDLFSDAFEDFQSQETAPEDELPF